MALPLRLGPLGKGSAHLQRSGFRFVKADGQRIEAGEVFAYCNLAFHFVQPQPIGPSLLDHELQVAVASRVPGRLRLADGAAPGGYLSILGVSDWDENSVVAEIEPEGEPPPGEDPAQVRLITFAARRMTGLADVHGGLLPGWHSQSRAWWGDDAGRTVTLLSIGICDATGVVKGDGFAFLEMFQNEAAPTQVVFTPDYPVMPCAPVLREQFARTPQEADAIEADLLQALQRTDVPPNAADLIFAGTLLTWLRTNPIAQRFDILAPDGVASTSRPDAILLSLNAEVPTLLRHKRLGYALTFLRHHRAAAGPAVRRWLETEFETVRRTTQDIRRDYDGLFRQVSAATGARFLVLNRMSTSGLEDIASYAPFDMPLSSSLANVASKEFNVMLDEFAEEGLIDVIDVDTIAATLGGATHLPDGMHESGTMQAAVRAQLIEALNGLRDR